MPEISRFYGIIIAMFWDDHNPPHFLCPVWKPQGYVRDRFLTSFGWETPTSSARLGRRVGFSASGRTYEKLGKGEKTESIRKDRSSTIRKESSHDS